MSNARWTPVIALVLAGTALAQGQQEAGKAGERTLENASADLRAQLEQSVAELAALREQLAEEKIPLDRELSDLEAELRQVRHEHQEATRLLDRRLLDLTTLKGDIKARNDEAGYVSSLLGDYIRGFEAGVHIAEKQRYDRELEAARLAAENDNLSREEVQAAQIAVVTASIERLFEGLGGTRFDGTAVDPDGLVKKGTFALVGPFALFHAADGSVTGTAEQRLGSLEPTVFTFADPANTAAAERVVAAGAGELPLDPTLGNAHKIEATQETLVEHVRKGGPVMVPILVMAAAALVVALYKWIALTLVRRPSKKQIAALLGAVGRSDERAAKEVVSTIQGPVGAMLASGVEHMREPAELIEEVMYENVLTARLKLQRMLPFVAICAASAPLLGLLGTVTGIINTFKQITVFGGGDVKMLSGGISEALITTEFGLIVAIPSLLLHAFLFRKARGVIGQMEASAVAFVNQVNRTAAEADRGSPAQGPSRELVRDQVGDVLREMLGRSPHDLAADAEPLRHPHLAKAELEPFRREAAREHEPTGRTVGVPRPVRMD